jgi:hypothetical protein
MSKYYEKLNQVEDAVQSNPVFTKAVEIASNDYKMRSNLRKDPKAVVAEAIQMAVNHYTNLGVNLHNLYREDLLEEAFILAVLEGVREKSRKEY